MQVEGSIEVQAADIRELFLLLTGGAWVALAVPPAPIPPPLPTPAEEIDG